MTAPAHTSSWYAAASPSLPCLPCWQGDGLADVCIVGAGYTGLSAAIELAGRGLSVVVLEAARIGWGASGRNGGQFITGFARGMDTVEHRAGQDDARRLWDLGQEAIALLAARVERYAIPCDLTWGWVHAALKSRHMREAEAEIRHLRDGYGYDRLQLLDSNGMHDHVGSDAYVGGVYDPGSGHLQPLAFAQGLARAAQAAGARIFEDSRVVGMDHGDSRRFGPVRVRTAKGTVTVNHVLICTNAYGDGLEDRALAGRTMPVNTYTIATEPLGSQSARRLLPSNAAIADMNMAVNYFRRSPDHRLLFGGGVSYSGMEPPGLRMRMRAKMLAVFPELAPARIDFCWSGRVAITVDRLPRLGRLAPNILVAHGYSGHGVALAGLCGKLLAEAVAGQAERFDLFARLPHLRFPGGKSALARTALLTLAMTWARLRDKL
jgi:gamma-glutamylputrescine oxidase